MSEFLPAVEYVLANEDPSGKGIVTTDRGGLTRWGISHAAFPHLDIVNLTREDAIAIYERDYWVFGGVTSQRLATKLLDTYVDLGHAGIKLLQQALGWLQAGPVVADGFIGPQTIDHANAADDSELVDELKFRLVKHYQENADPCEKDGLWRRAVKG